MTEDRTPGGQRVADALLYAPLGFVLELPGQLPKWVERGRNQVGVARMVGTFALQNAPNGTDRLTSGLRHGFGLAVQNGVAVPTALPEPDASSPADGVGDTSLEEEPAEPAPDVETLAIPEYESLAASHVIGRLEGLDPAELTDLAAFERANRRRRTVLHRIDELLGEPN